MVGDPTGVPRRRAGHRGSDRPRPLSPRPPLSRPGRQPLQVGLDLQGQEPGEQPALVEGAAHQPESVLARPGPHVAHEALLVEAPDDADAVGDLVAAQPPDARRLLLVPRGEHHEIGRDARAIREPQAGRAERRDVARVHEPDAPLRDELRAADVDVVAAALAQVLHVEPGLVGTEVQLEAHGGQPVQQLLIELAGLGRQPLVGITQHRVRDGGRDQVDVLDRALGVQPVDQGAARDQADHAGRVALHDRHAGRAVAVQVLGDIVAAVPRADHDGMLAAIARAAGELAGVHDLAREPV